MCFMHIPYSGDKLLGEVVLTIKESMWEHSMHELDYGKDWELLSWEHRIMLPKTELKKTLKQLGIKPGFVLEIVPYCTKERLASIPPHPDALINYGSLSA
ncbi:hypothetical protein B0T37_07740 [Chromobacterium violaceum]|nr:hypothetical protein B0T37_07740 [Chromobacterium violaceum]